MAMEELRTLLRNSAATSLAIGLALATLIPLAIVPLTRFLKRRKRSINQHLESKGSKPDDYAFVVARTIALSGAATGMFLHVAANSDRILWSWAEATPAAVVKTLVGCFLLREFFAYWSHRFFHSKLLWRFHAEHHAILHVYDDYDGYYIDLFETTVAAFLAYLPAFLVPQAHVIPVIAYTVLTALFVFSVNHCGREVRIAFDWFGLSRPWVFYDSRHHDDHHVYRRGNYAELLPVLDRIFGTAVAVQRRRSLPAQRLWKRARKVKTAAGAAAAFRSAGQRARDKRPGVLRRASGLVRRSSSSVVDVLRLLSEVDDDCQPQWERLQGNSEGSGL